MAQAKLILREVVGCIDLVDQRRRGNKVGHQDRTAVEISGIRVGHRRGTVGVNQLRNAVQRVFQIGDRAVDPVQNGVAPTGKVGWITNDPVEDSSAAAIASSSAGLRGEGHHQVASGQRRDGTLVLGRTELLVDLNRPVDAIALRVVLLQEHAHTAAIGAIVVAIGDRKSAALNSDDIRLGLGVVDDFIDKEFVTDPVARTIEPLRIDTGAGGIPEIVGDVGFEHHHIPAVLRRRHSGAELREPFRRVDLDRAADLAVIRREPLHEDAGVKVAGIIDIEIGINDDIGAVRLCRDICRRHTGRSKRRNHAFRTDRAACVVEALHVKLVPRSVERIPPVAHQNEVAVIERGERR